MSRGAEIQLRDAVVEQTGLALIGRRDAEVDLLYILAGQTDNDAVSWSPIAFLQKFSELCEKLCSHMLGLYHTEAHMPRKASKSAQTPLRLLHWTEPVKAKAGTDPLGLALRVGARLASQLLYCITSITPRARYYSFLPWCVREYRKTQRGQKNDPGIVKVVQQWEKALVLGCVIHHEGKPCLGGGLVGSSKVVEWYKSEDEIPAQLDLSSRSFSKNPALGQYVGSLINLGVFKATEAAEENEKDDEEASADDGREVTMDDLELDDLVGDYLASCYEATLDSAKVKPKLGGKRAELERWAEVGGFCELRDSTAEDREALRELFFDTLVSDRDRSAAHSFRAASLTLVLELARQLGLPEAREHLFDTNTASFDEATYYEQVFYCPDEEETSKQVSIPIAWPEPLRDIMLRWRMFHFHQRVRFGLETLFGFLVTRAQEASLAGLSIDEVLHRVSLPGVGRPLNRHLGLPESTVLWELPLREIWSRCGIGLDTHATDWSVAFSEKVQPAHALSEIQLEWLWDEHANAETGALAAALCLATALARFTQWKGSKWAIWLADATRDDYLDVSPLLLELKLRQHFLHWPDATLGELLSFTLRRFVVSQHEAMAYTKTHDGTRSFFWISEGRLFARGFGGWLVTVGNARFGSVTSILADLALLARDDDDCLRLTPDGEAMLKHGLERLRQR